VGSRGSALVGFWRLHPQKLETSVHEDFEYKQNTGTFCAIFVCYASLLINKKMWMMSGGIDPIPPSGYTPVIIGDNMLHLVH